MARTTKSTPARLETATKQVPPRTKKKRTAPLGAHDVNRLFELAHLKTHALRLEFSLRNSITAREIYRRLLSVLRVGYIDLDAAPAKYIKADSAAGSAPLRAFTQHLNQSPEFDQDGLDLTTHAFDAVKTMRDLGGVIVGWYKSNGWTVAVE